MDPTFPYSAKKITIVVILFAVFFAILGFVPHLTPASEYSIATDSGSIGFSDCDATDQYIYFSGKYKQAKVHTFDLDGNYLYTILMDDIENGKPEIRCWENKLYVQLSNGQVFVFQGREMLDHLSGKEADELGYTALWFREGVSRVSVDGEYLILLDEDGNISGRIEKPEKILTGEKNNTNIWLHMPVFVCAAVILVVSKTILHRRG